MELHEVIKNFYQLLLEGKTAVLSSIFGGEPLVDTSNAGLVQGTTAFKVFVTEQQALLKAHAATVEAGAFIVGENRLVGEVVVWLTKEGEKVDLPIALVAELSGEKVSVLRIYHSNYPITGGHAVRHPQIALAPNLALPYPVATYFEALDNSNRPALYSILTEKTYVREPSGNRYKHEGLAALDKFYEFPLSTQVPLLPCTMTFDGLNCAVEYIWEQVGAIKFTPQPGIAVFELAGTDKLAAVRVYDDIVPPLEH
jgi:hypothetical protein